MSNFVTALLKQRREAKKAEPKSNGRLKEIIAVLNKFNYDDGFTPEIIVGILEELGPTYVKLGQIASQQSEYMPAEYCEALSKLRSKVAPMDLETVYAQIEKYLGKPANEIFATFNEKPLGSASVAQVHKATLQDGTVVAVKVRRPGIVDTVTRDFALIEKVLDKFVKSDGGGFDIKGMIVELERTSKIELDFTNEANNIDRFWKNNQGREKVQSPKCYRDLTCEAVLVEDFVSGHTVSDTDYINSLSEEERDKIATLVADNFATQVLTDGFYHADPHSGNVLVQELEGGEHGIEWIDFGMMGTLTSKQRQSLIDIVTGVVMQDAYGLKKTIMQIAHPVGEVNHGEILGICEDMCGQFNGSDFGDFELGDLLDAVLDSLEGGNYKVDPFLSNLSRGIIAIQGTVKTLSPNVNILNSFTSKVNLGFDLSNFDTEHLKEMNPEIALKLLQLAKGITDSSTKTAEALDMLEKGQIKVRTDLAFEEKALDTVNRLASYLIRALLIVAVIIGSSLLCTTSAFAGDKVSAVTIVFRGIGLVGFVVGLFFAQRLFRNMLKGK